MIVGLEDSLPEFREVVCYLNMPTVDMSACLQQIFDTMALSNEFEFNRMLENTANWMGKGEGLYENSRLDEYEKMLVVNSTLKLGKSIKEKIKYLNLYIDGHLPYAFNRMVGDDAVMLEFSDQNYN